MTSTRRDTLRSAVVLAAAVAACAPGESARTSLPPCDADHGGLTLPAGFCATVFAELGARVRHIGVRPDGDVFVAVYAPRGESWGGGVLALRDTTGDGKADLIASFAPGPGGSGLAVSGDQVFLGMDDAVLRYTVQRGTLAAGAPDTIVAGLPADRSHAAKSIALSPGGRIFVNIGSPSNACQHEDRQPGSPGRDPCPELERRAGVWVFDANRTGQTQADGERFATGIRNAVALALHPGDGRPWVAQHGRDNLSQNWRDIFDDTQSAEKPAEELFALERGDDFGWPYCYYDPDLGSKVLAPEYGGDGRTRGRCAETRGPVFAFPAHWAPNALLFYTGDQFPARYREGVFVAFHGSWNRAPLPQAGYNVVFLPFNAGAPLAGFEVFADGFAGTPSPASPADAAYRPTGLAQGPDGSIWITDDVRGRIWRVMYRRP